MRYLAYQLRGGMTALGRIKSKDQVCLGQHSQQLKGNVVGQKAVSFLQLAFPSKKKQRRGGVPFFKEDFRTRQRHMLAWLVEADTIEDALAGNPIDENAVEQIPENIPSTILEPQIDLNLMKPLFTEEAWMVVEAVVHERQNLPWLCCKCGSDISDKESIGCDSCMEWVHLECAKLKKIPKTKFWYCPSCK